MSQVVVWRRLLVGVSVFGLALSLCAQTGLVPLTEMGPQTYLGFSGGLYPNASNELPAAHAAAGRTRALAIQPLDTLGNPSPTGKLALLSIGMSNTTQEFCSGGGRTPCAAWTFVGQALLDPEVDHTALTLVNGARGGQTAMTWDDPADPNYDRVRDVDLAEQGLTEAQVQIAWVKVADANPSLSLPDSNADAYVLETYIGDIARALKVRYPNIQLVFLSSRIYAGYASTPLNPEPYAYESGFAVKWAIQAQIDQMANGGAVVDPRAGDLNYGTVAPWIGWGAYLWGDGLNARCDGLVWESIDFQSDGTHPSQSGEQKVGTLLLDFFKTDERTRPWFLELGDVAIAPDSGIASGGTVATITGRSFQPGAAVSIGGVPATGVVVTPGSITATAPALSPGTLNTVQVTNPDASSGSIPNGYFADFLDTPTTHLFHDFVETILREGVTAGCGSGNYCPDEAVSRAQMAPLLLKSRYGVCFAPPAATGSVFGDVPADHPFADWIEELAALNITGGCGNGNYCPENPVTRAEMAVLLLKTLLGAGYVPPAPIGFFDDVPLGSFADAWVEDLYNRGITAGCSTAPPLYCPDADNTRGEMAVFLVKTFSLP